MSSPPALGCGKVSATRRAAYLSPCKARRMSSTTRGGWFAVSLDASRSSRAVRAALSTVSSSLRRSRAMSASSPSDVFCSNARRRLAASSGESMARTAASSPLAAVGAVADAAGVADTGADAAPGAHGGSPVTFEASSGRCAVGPQTRTMVGIALTRLATLARTLSSVSRIERSGGELASSATSNSANRVSRCGSFGAKARLPGPVGKATWQSPGRRGRRSDRALQPREDLALQRDAGLRELRRHGVQVAAGRDEKVLGVRLKAMADEIEHCGHVGVGRDGALQLGDLALNLRRRDVVKGRDVEAEALELRLEVAKAFLGRRQVLLGRVVRGVADQERIAFARRLRPGPVRPGDEQRKSGERRSQQAAPAEARRAVSGHSSARIRWPARTTPQAWPNR